MNDIKTATVLRHSTAGHSGTITDVLSERGVEITMSDVFDTGLDVENAINTDLLIVLGGECGVYQNDLYPFLKDEMNIIRQRIDAGRRVLGVCLGAQLVATSCGGRAYQGPTGDEIGWRPLVLSDAGKQSMARHLAADLTYVPERHRDTFDLPPGATLLASTQQYENQIFAIGNHVLGFQCHIEVTPYIARDWNVALASAARLGMVDLDVFRADTDKWLGKLQGQARIALNEWFDTPV